MSWSIAQLKRWLDDLEPKLDDLDPFELLDLTPAAAPSDVQPAYHTVARSRHPDLFRTRLEPADFDRLVRVYSRITAAYADLRDPVRCAAIAHTLRRPPPPKAPPPAPPAPLVTTPPPKAPQPVAVGTAQTPKAPQPAQGTAQTARAPQPAQGTAQTARAPQPTPGAGPAASSDGEVDPSRAMNPRALTCYRRALGALQVGDRMTALLQLRMAIAADPSSTLLRNALAEVLATP